MTGHRSRRRARQTFERIAGRSPPDPTYHRVMNLPRLIFGLLLLVVGLVWMLQGLGLLPGSFMTGRLEWTFYGAIAVLAGGVVNFSARRRR